MTKLIPIFIDGKCWVQLSQVQILAIGSFLPINALKKIRFQGIELKDCLEYEIYEWLLKTSDFSGKNSAIQELI